MQINLMNDFFPPDINTVVSIIKEQTKIKNDFYFYTTVTSEQVDYANQLVQHSVDYHTVKNKWDNTSKENNTFDLRFTGSLGEIVFADVYGLVRPTRSFGASDGQDFGKDFELQVEGKKANFDIKSMKRNNNAFYKDYVLNIPSYQLNKINSLTDYYFHINIHKEKCFDNNYVASFVGFVNKNEIKSGRVGKLYLKGTNRIRANGTQFQFSEDTYEVDLIDLNTPMLDHKIEQLNGYGTKRIRL